MVDVDREQQALQRYVEGHRQRVAHLEAKIDRLTRELRVHEMIKTLAENSRLPEAMRSLEEMTRIESADSTSLRTFLAERGVSVPTELDIRVERAGDDFWVVGVHRDDWFPAHLSWSSKEGFQGRIVNNSWRHLQSKTSSEDV